MALLTHLQIRDAFVIPNTAEVQEGHRWAPLAGACRFELLARDAAAYLMPCQKFSGKKPRRVAGWVARSHPTSSINRSPGAVLRRYAPTAGQPSR
jgi:hypothetical protein